MNKPQFTYPIFDALGKNLFHGTYSHAPSHSSIVYALQEHRDQIEIIESIPTSPPRCDALITQKQGLFLAIKHADCQAAIFHDPVTQTSAAVHAGWKGLVQNIYQKTIQAMRKTYSVLPENLIVAIGPSLGPKNSQFLHYESEFPKPFWAYQESPFYFNLRSIARDQLLAEGILKENIYIEETDTFSDMRCYSYRRDKTSQRMVTLMGRTEVPTDR